MPDIAMCMGQGCPIKDSCFRHVATPNPYRQSYMEPERKEDGSCEYYSHTKLKPWFAAKDKKP